MVAGEIAGGEPVERRGGGRRDGIEDAEQAVREVLAVAGDELRVVEVVAVYIFTPAGSIARMRVS